MPFLNPQPIPRAQRTLANIVYGCLVTTILCAWTAVHPNLPPKNERYAGLRRRLKLMFWTILVPELILAWAVRQYFAAREARDIYNNAIRRSNVLQAHRERRPRRWTMVHGHLLVMGGYVLVEEDIDEIEEILKPGWFATAEAWEDYHLEFERQKQSVERVLVLKDLEKTVQDTNAKFPFVIAADIEDKSKGDELSKFIAILQALWFILQCILRGVHRLALTELELITLSLASLNAVTYLFWWDKPLCVNQPVRIYNAKDTSSSEEAFDKHQTSIGGDDVVPSVGDVLNATFEEISGIGRSIYGYFKRRTVLNFACFEATFLIRTLVLLSVVILLVVMSIFPLAIAFLLNLIKTEPPQHPKPTKDTETGRIAADIIFFFTKVRYKLTSPICKLFGWPLKFAIENKRWWIPMFSIFPVALMLLVIPLVLLSPILAIFSFSSFTYAAVFGIITSKHLVIANGVPCFYAPHTASDRFSRMVVFAVFGVIFGGIHCIGWNFSFPTHLERSLWRINSLILTFVPSLAAPMDWGLENRKHLFALELLFTILLSVYVLSRFSLIVQALVLLRNPPPGAFVTIDWTTYIPHIS